MIGRNIDSKQSYKKNIWDEHVSRHYWEICPSAWFFFQNDDVWLCLLKK